MMNEGYLAVIIIFFNPLFYDLFSKYLNEHLLFVTALYQMYNKILTCIWLFLLIVKIFIVIGIDKDCYLYHELKFILYLVQGNNILKTNKNSQTNNYYYKI